MDFRPFLRFFGKTLLLFGLTLFLLSFFLSSLGVHAPELPGLLKEQVTLQVLLQASGQNFTEQEITAMKETCQKNPEQQSCDEVLDPGKTFETPEMNLLIQQITEYGKKTVPVRFLGMGLFLLGCVLFWIGNAMRGMSAFRIALSSAISSALAVFYYNVIPLLLHSGAFLSLLPKDAPAPVLTLLMNALGEWMTIVIGGVMKISILLTLLFGVAALFLFLFRRS